MKLSLLLKRATPLPWKVNHNCKQGIKKQMSAVQGVNDHLICGSLICRVESQDIIDHALLSHAVNILPKVLDALHGLINVAGMGERNLINEPMQDEVRRCLKVLAEAEQVNI